MADIVERLREWAKWCHDNNVKAEVQRTMHEAADEIERLREQNQRQADEIVFSRERGIADEKRIAKLQAVVDAARDDMEGAKANCGKYPEAAGYKDCSAWIERGLRCSDCPVEVWLASTSEALAALEDDDD